MDELDRALENYQKAIEIKPNFAESLNNLGTTYLLVGELNYQLNIFLMR